MLLLLLMTLLLMELLLLPILLALLFVRSVEDMMKRSFSEFRTQRELGAKELPKIMKKSMDALNKIKATVSVVRPIQH